MTGFTLYYVHVYKRKYKNRCVCVFTYIFARVFVLYLYLVRKYAQKRIFKRVLLTTFCIRPRTKAHNPSRHPMNLPESVNHAKRVILCVKLSGTRKQQR